MTETPTSPSCPMASMCQGMAKKSIPGVVTMIPGLVLILFGILILLKPEILAWLIALLLIMMGCGALFMANMMRKFSAMGEMFDD